MSKQTYPTDVLSITIPNGAGGISAAVDLTGLIVVRIIMPATWVSAAVSFSASETEAGTFTDLFDFNGVEYNISAANALASHRIMIPPSDMLGDCWLKIRSGLTGAAVNQTADRILVIKARGLA